MSSTSPASASADGSADPSSSGPIVDASTRSTPAPGASVPAPSVRPLRKRERASVIVALVILGYLLVVLFDRTVGIPNR